MDQSGIKNTCHLADWLDNDIPDKSVNLIIADPPYFEVKGDFDFVWSDFDSYLADVEKWAKECKRILADNGSLFWWGHAKKIAYSQVILDKYFKIENSLVWHKNECQTMRNEKEKMRSFIPVTERVLFYSNEMSLTEGSPARLAENKYKYEIGMAKTKLMEPIISYLITEMERAGYTCKRINTEAGTCMASHWFARTSQWVLPTRAWYEELQKLFNYEYLRKDYEDLRKDYEYLRKDYEDLRKDYEYLRKDYEYLRRPFNLSLYGFYDVIKESQESHITADYDHDTKKPLTLTKKLIQTTTRPGDLVVIPFGGSGTEVEACIETGRSYTCYEISEKHYQTIKRREAAAMAQPLLFQGVA